MLWWSGQSTFVSLVRRSPLDFEDFEDLLDFAMSAERSLFAEYFDHEGAQRPNVDFLVVDLLAQQDFDGPVPEAADFLREGLFFVGVHEFYESEITDFDDDVILVLSFWSDLERAFYPRTPRCFAV